LGENYPKESLMGPFQDVVCQRSTVMLQSSPVVRSFPVLEYLNSLAVLKQGYALSYGKRFFIIQLETNYIYNQKNYITHSIWGVLIGNDF
jgi:hypothetical protein